MTAGLRIDTLKFVRRLTGAGMEPRMAEAIVEGLAEADTSELATKGDLTATEVALRSDLASFRTELASLRAEFKGDLGSVRAELKADVATLQTSLAETKAEIFRFMLLQAVGIIGLTVTLIKLLP